jgi:O-acetyl-ADP-ribose deacetylase
MSNLIRTREQALSLNLADRLELMSCLTESLRNGQFGRRSTSLTLLGGDITKVPADALVAAVNSSGKWGARPNPAGDWEIVNPRSIDAAICRTSGVQFHVQALQLLNSPEGSTLLAGRQALHDGAFNHLLFVVDDWQAPLSDIILPALIAADRGGLHSVSLPLLRTGAGAKVGGSLEEKVSELLSVARSFKGRYLERIHLVAGSESDEALVRNLMAAQSLLVEVVQGDITQVDSDGLITGLNSHGVWAGGVDQAIMGVAGGQFHEQAKALLGRDDGEVLVATSQEPHGGAFRHVVFSVDNLNRPLYEVLTAGLEAAEKAGLATVTVPAMRMGVLMNAGGTPQAKIAEMAKAVLDFRQQARAVKKVTFVIYGDPETYQVLHSHFRASQEF